MHIKELTFMGIGVWPPQWISSGHTIGDRAVLMNVKMVFGTDLLRIDVEQKGIHFLGIMLLEEDLRAACYRKLKEHLGRPLAEIAELEIELVQTPRARAAMGSGSLLSL